MAKRSFKRPVLGDVVEIPLVGGFAYAQYVFKHTDPPQYGELIRVLPGVFDVPPDNLQALVEGPDRFVQFYPLGVAVSARFVRIVGQFDVPDRFRTLPLFKAGGFNDPKTKEIRSWWLWDGQKSWQEDPLAVEHYDLPDRGIVGHPLLMELIETGWHPRDEVFRGRPDRRTLYENWKRSQADSSLADSVDAGDSGSTPPALGDLIEIPLSNGSAAAAQYVLHHAGYYEYGELIRVLPGTFKDWSNKTGKLASAPERFITFYPLRKSLAAGLVRTAGSGAVPDRFQTLPTFKIPGGRDWTTGAISECWTWAGDDTEHFKELPLEHYDLPLRGIVSHSGLVEWIETGWHPRDEVFRGRPDRRNLYEERKGLPGKAAASPATRLAAPTPAVEPEGATEEMSDAEDEESGDGGGQAVIVQFKYTGQNLDPLFELEDQLIEALEASGKGVCDGHEIATNLKNGTFYLYGPSADELYAAVRTILASSKCLKQTTATLRYGAPDDDAPEKRVKVTAE
jgi:hypothetical protein